MADDPRDGRMYSGGDITPRPDPTLLTSAALAQQIGVLREYLVARIDGAEAVQNTRFGAMDRAIVLLQTLQDRIPDQVDRKVANLQALHDERFRGIQVQFDERDVRVKESAAAATTAVNAALQAAKEAVGAQNTSFTLGIDKSEKATLEQINQQRVLLDKTTSSLDEKIDDLKDRMARLESIGLGRTEAVGDHRASAADVRGYVTLALGAILGLLGLIDFIARLAH